MHRIIPLLLAGLLLAQPAAAEIYKCRLPGGKTEISNAPCPGGSGTLTVRPDEVVPEANRLQAERDVERMRNYVEKRESAQRADAVAERQAQSQQRLLTAAAPSRSYGDRDACLRDLASRVLEAAQRAQLEAECRSLTNPPDTQVQVYVPVYGVAAQPYPHPVPRHAHPPHPYTDPAFTPQPSMVVCSPGKPCKR